MICVGLSTWLTPAPATAQPLPIEWDAPPGCPSLADVTSWLEAVVPAELRTRLEGITASVRITRVERRFHADIRVSHGAYSGEREVDGRRCEEVARSSIVVISVSLAEAVEQAETPPPVTEPAQDDPPLAEPAVAPPVEEPRAVPAPVYVPEPAPLPALLLDLGAGVLFDFGRPLAARLELGGRRPITRGFSLGVRARIAPRTEARRAEGHARLSLVTVGVEGCGTYDASEVAHLLGCARFDVGAFTAEGRYAGFEGNVRGTAVFVDVAAYPIFEFGRRVRFRISPELEARIVRPRLTVSDVGTVYRVPPVGGSIDLGLVILIP